MPKKVGLPDHIKSRHDVHLVDELSTRTRTSIIRSIPIDRLIPNIMQPRKDMGNLEELAESIREKGIIEPIIVRTKNGKFEIVAGERRYKAAKLAELAEVPCIEHDVPDNEAMEITIIENIQRKDLNVFETAFSLKSLGDIYGYSHGDIARKIGKSRVTVSELIRVTDLPPDVIKRCQDLNITSKSFILELAKLQDKEKIMQLLDRYEEKPFSRDRLKEKRKKGDEKKNALKAVHFKFTSSDRAVRINFKIKSEEYRKERIIEILEQLITDIRDDKIKELK